MLRPHAPFAALFALAAALRLYGLGWLPAPAGDEGNWTWIAFRLAQGQPAGLDADAGFVSLVFARLIAAAFALLGPSFFAARLVTAAGTLCAVAAAYGVLAALGHRRAGLAAAALLAVHPWAIAWGRTASVPYALALACATAGALALAAGVRARRPLAVAAGVLVTCAGAQFSPLAAVPFAACALWTVLVPAHRWALRHALTWAALAVAALYTAPVVLAAGRVARAARPREHFADFGPRLALYLHAMGTGLAGEATLRHFTHAALPLGAAALLALPVVLAAALAARRDVRRASALPGLGPLYLLTALVLVPLLLAPGRAWHLERIDTDRYLFATLPGLALCAADLAAAASARVAPRVTAGALALLLAVVAAATERGARAMLTGGGPDLGLSTREGGGAYRGWRPAREREATVVLVRDAVRAELGPAQGATILIADQAFHPIHFANVWSGLPAFNVNAGPVPPRADGQYFFVLWADAVLAAPHAPPDAVRANAGLRARMLGAEFAGARRVRLFAQRDGSPLIELWRASRVAP